MESEVNDLWARMIEAPLEKILIDDCRERANAVFVELHRCLEAGSEADVLAAVRMVSVGLDLPPPKGAQLAMYVRLLKRLGQQVLLQTATELIRDYKYPTFPKPADWLRSTSDLQKLIEKMDLLLRVYAGRRRMAELKYGKR